MSKPIPDFDAGFQAGFAILLKNPADDTQSMPSLRKMADDFFSRYHMPSSAYVFDDAPYLPTMVGWNKVTILIEEDRTGSISDEKLDELHDEVTRIMETCKTIG